MPLGPRFLQNLYDLNNLDRPKRTKKDPNDLNRPKQT